MNHVILRTEHQRQRAMQIVAALPIENPPRVVTFGVHKPTRSTQQNAYLWGVVYPTILSDGLYDGKSLIEHGWRAEDLHEYYLGECFGWETLEGPLRRKRPVKRSSRLNKAEFADYVEFIKQRAAEMGVYVPDPNEDVE